MRTLYEAASALEAHMLQDVLRQEGISARIDGEYLTGALGELPAAGLVRLVVDEDDYAAARAVIERWEQASPASAAPAPARGDAGANAARRIAAPRALALAAMLGLLAGSGLTWSLLRVPALESGLDHNGDGVIDEHWITSASGTPIESRSDRNFDGRIDYIVHFNGRGQTESIDADDDFDGVFESHFEFSKGNLETASVDTDGDGIADQVSHARFGVVQSTDFIDAHTGLPLRVEHYRLGKLVSADIDSDGDGTLDTRLVYTALGVVDHTERLAPLAGPADAPATVASAAQP